MNVCITCHDNPPNSCSDTSVWNKVVDQSTDRHYHPYVHDVSVAKTMCDFKLHKSYIGTVCWTISFINKTEEKMKKVILISKLHCYHDNVYDLDGVVGGTIEEIK